MENFNEILQKAKADQNLIAEYKNNQRIFPDISSEEFTSLFLVHANTLLLKKLSDNRFERSADNKPVITQLKLWLQNSTEFVGNTKKGILINGKIGSGKTLIMESFMRTYNSLAEKEKQMQYKDSRLLFKEIIEDGVKAFSGGVLFIDDLGKEPLEYINYGYKSLPMVELLSERYRLGRLTFATSNFSVDKTFREKYGDTISDRIKEMFNIIELKGESKR
jgi:DNA replication protein DnaC